MPFLGEIAAAWMILKIVAGEPAMRKPKLALPDVARDKYTKIFSPMRDLTLIIIRGSII